MTESEGKRPDAAARQTGAGLGLGRRLCARYGNSPGVAWLPGAPAAVTRSARFTAAHLPLLARLQRRWAHSALVPRGWTSPVYAWPAFESAHMGASDLSARIQSRPPQATHFRAVSFRREPGSDVPEILRTPFPPQAPILSPAPPPPASQTVQRRATFEEIIGHRPETRPDRAASPPSSSTKLGRPVFKRQVKGVYPHQPTAGTPAQAASSLQRKEQPPTVPNVESGSSAAVNVDRSIQVGSFPPIVQRDIGRRISNPESAGTLASSESQAEPQRSSDAILSPNIDSLLSVAADVGESIRFGSSPATVEPGRSTLQSSLASAESPAVSESQAGPQHPSDAIPRETNESSVSVLADLGGLTKPGSVPSMVQRDIGTPQSSPASAEAPAVGESQAGPQHPSGAIPPPNIHSALSVAADVGEPTGPGSFPVTDRPDPSTHQSSSASAEAPFSESQAASQGPSVAIPSSIESGLSVAVDVGESTRPGIFAAMVQRDIGTPRSSPASAEALAFSESQAGQQHASGAIPRPNDESPLSVAADVSESTKPGIFPAMVQRDIGSPHSIQPQAPDAILPSKTTQVAGIHPDLHSTVAETSTPFASEVALSGSSPRVAEVEVSRSPSAPERAARQVLPSEMIQRHMDVDKPRLHVRAQTPIARQSAELPRLSGSARSTENRNDALVFLSPGNLENSAKKVASSEPGEPLAPGLIRQRPDAGEVSKSPGNVEAFAGGAVSGMALPKAQPGEPNAFGRDTIQRSRDKDESGHVGELASETKVHLSPSKLETTARQPASAEMIQLDARANAPAMSRPRASKELAQSFVQRDPMVREAQDAVQAGGHVDVRMVQRHLESGQASPAASGLRISRSDTDIRYAEPPNEPRIESSKAGAAKRQEFTPVDVPIQRYPLQGPQSAVTGREKSAASEIVFAPPGNIESALRPVASGMVQPKAEPNALVSEAETVKLSASDAGDPESTGRRFTSADMVQRDVRASEPVTPGLSTGAEPAHPFVQRDIKTSAEVGPPGPVVGEARENRTTIPRNRDAAEAESTGSQKRESVPVEMVQRHLQLGHVSPGASEPRVSRSNPDVDNTDSQIGPHTSDAHLFTSQSFAPARAPIQRYPLQGPRSDAAGREQSTVRGGEPRETPGLPVFPSEMVQRQTKSAEAMQRTGSVSAPQLLFSTTPPSDSQRQMAAAGAETLTHKEVRNLNVPPEQKLGVQVSVPVVHAVGSVPLLDSTSNTSDAEPERATMPLIQRRAGLQPSTLARPAADVGDSDVQLIDLQIASQAGVPAAQPPQVPSSPMVSQRSEGAASRPLLSASANSETGLRRSAIVHGQHPIQRSFDATDRRPTGSRFTGAGVHLERLPQSSAVIERNVSNGSQRGGTTVNRAPMPGVVASPNPAPPPPPAPAGATGGRSGPSNVDISGLADQVYQILIRRLSSERQRKGV